LNSLPSLLVTVSPSPHYDANSSPQCCPMQHTTLLQTPSLPSCPQSLHTMLPPPRSIYSNVLSLGSLLWTHIQEKLILSQD
jgi:hypothetical protein